MVETVDPGVYFNAPKTWGLPEFLARYEHAGKSARQFLYSTKGEEFDDVNQDRPPMVEVKPIEKFKPKGSYERVYSEDGSKGYKTLSPYCEYCLVNKTQISENATRAPKCCPEHRDLPQRYSSYKAKCLRSGQAPLCKSEWFKHYYNRPLNERIAISFREMQDIEYKCVFCGERFKRLYPQASKTNCQNCVNEAKYYNKYIEENGYISKRSFYKIRKGVI